MKKFTFTLIALVAIFISQTTQAAYTVKGTADVQSFFNVTVPATSSSMSPGMNTYLKLGETIKALEYHLAKAKAEIATSVPATSDTQAPTVTFVTASTSQGIAIIVWKTDELSDSKVRYGTTSNFYFGTQSVSTFTLNHAVTITSVIPGAKYFYVVESRDAAGNVGQSKEYTFTIPANVKKVGLGSFFQSYFQNVAAQVVYMFGK